MVASERFFKYIKELGAQTKSYLEQFPTKLPTHPPLVKVYRQKLTILRDCWSELHRYVKPAVDADTLNVPFALMEVFYKQLNELPKFPRGSPQNRPLKVTSKPAIKTDPEHHLL